MGLNNNQQALVVFLSTLIAALAGWATAGFPTSKFAVGAVVAAILVGAGLALNLDSSSQKYLKFDLENLVALGDPDAKLT